MNCLRLQNSNVTFTALWCPEWCGKCPVYHNADGRAIKSALLFTLLDVKVKPQVSPVKWHDMHSAPVWDPCQAVSHAASLHQSSDRSRGQSESQQSLCNSIRWSQTLKVNKTILVLPPPLPTPKWRAPPSPPLQPPPILLLHPPLHWQYWSRLDHAYTKQTQLPLA